MIETEWPGVIVGNAGLELSRTGHVNGRNPFKRDQVRSGKRYWNTGGNQKTPA